MNHNPSSPRRSLRRIVAIGGGALLGVAAAFAAAAPASAHHSVVEGSAVCDTATGEWVVTWQVNTVAPSGVNHYKLTEVKWTPEGSTLTGISAAGKNDGYSLTVGQPVTGTQRLPGTETSASLSVKAQWENGFKEKQPASKTVQFGGTCDAPTPPESPSPSPSPDQPTPTPDQPSPSPSESTPTPSGPQPNASFSSSCDGSVEVTLTNGAEATESADFTVKGGTFTKKVTVAPGEKSTVTVPTNGAKEVTVTSGDQTFEGGFTQPEDCSPVEISWLSDCDSLTVSVENPEGTTPVDVTATDGTESQTITLQPGESAEATFDAEEGTVVTVSIAGGESTDIAWEQPEDCDGSGGGLPVTGASIGGAIGGGAALLAIGGGLFYFFRRRRIRFTAA